MPYVPHGWSCAFSILLILEGVAPPHLIGGEPYKKLAMVPATIWITIKLL
jgi:hypothetical protein